MKVIATCVFPDCEGFAEATWKKQFPFQKGIGKEDGKAAEASSSV